MTKRGTPLKLQHFSLQYSYLQYSLLLIITKCSAVFLCYCFVCAITRLFYALELSEARRWIRATILIKMVWLESFCSGCAAAVT